MSPSGWVFGEQDTPIVPDGYAQIRRFGLHTVIVLPPDGQERAVPPVRLRLGILVARSSGRS
jgi:hypothetical protein